MWERTYIVTSFIKKLKKGEKEWVLSPQGFKRVSDDKSVDISKLPEDDKGLYYKDEPYTTKKLQQRLIITYSPKYALYQKSIRSKQIERAQAMLDSGNTKRTAGTQTIQPDLLEQQQLQKKVRLPISSIILMNIRSLKKASMMDFMQYARTCQTMKSAIF